MQFSTLRPILSALCSGLFVEIAWNKYKILVYYLRKNGKTMIIKAMSFLRGKIGLIRQYLNKVDFACYDFSYFKLKNGQITE